MLRRIAGTMGHASRKHRLKAAASAAAMAAGMLLCSPPAQANVTTTGSNCSTGTVTTTGTATGQVIIGCVATGSLTVDANGSLTTANLTYTGGSIGLVDGYFTGGNGSILVNGNGTAGSATLNVSHAVEIGFSGGIGSLTVQNGGLAQVATSGYEITVANSNSSGSLLVDGAGSKVISGSELYVAAFSGGTASLTVQNGGVVQTGSTGVDNGSLLAGTGGNTSATVLVTGTNSALNTHGVILGDGFDAGSNASLTISNGGTVTATTVAGAGSGVGVGASGNASILVTGAGSSLQVAPITSGFLAGHEISIGGYGNGSLVVDQSATVSAAGANIAVSGGSLGTQTAYPGTLTVKNGASLTAASVSVNPNGTLNGNGTLNADVILNGGDIAPGNSPGTITVNGDLDAVSGIFNLEIASDSLADHLDVSGNVTIGKDVVFNLIFEYAPPANDVVSLEDFFSLTGGGSFSFDPGFDLASQLTYSGLPGGSTVFVTADAQRLELTTGTGVPEPDSIALLGGGMAALAAVAGLRRRRSRAALT